MSTITTYYESDPAFTDLVATSGNGVNQFVDAGDIPALHGVSEMTVSTWIKLLPGIVSNATFMAKWDFFTQGTFGFGLSPGAIDELRLFIAESIVSTGNNQLNTTDANLALSTWYNMVIVYNGNLAAANRLKVYRTRTLLSANIVGTIPPTLTNGTASLKFFKFGGMLDRFWNGLQDNPAIFLKAFNQSEVNELSPGDKAIDPATHSQAAFLINTYYAGDQDIFPTWKDHAGSSDGTMISMTPANFVADTP